MELIVIPTLWALMGLIGGLIGRSKGRELAGCLWGVILGPIGWLIIALSGPKWTCASCGGGIVKGAPKCKNCGDDVSWG